MRRFFRRFRRVPSRREAALKSRIGELETALADTVALLAAERRTTYIQKQEIDLLSGIIARDRERVRAEMAQAAWKMAELGR